MSTADKLAAALTLAGAPYPMVTKAREGYYDDFKSPLDMPINQLVADARANGLNDIAIRAMSGEFDATAEESDAWAKSPEGQAIMRELFGQS